MPLSIRDSELAATGSLNRPRRLEIKPHRHATREKHGGRSKEVRAELTELRRIMRMMGEIDKALREHVSA